MNRLIVFCLLMLPAAVSFSCASHQAEDQSRRAAPAPDSTASADSAGPASEEPVPAIDSAVDAAADGLPPDSVTAPVIIDTAAAGADSLPADTTVIAADSLAAEDSLAPRPTARIRPPPAEDSAAADTALPPPNPRALRYNAIYISSGAIANGELMAKYIEKAKRYKLGGFVMDMKDDRGYLSWRSEHPVARKIGSGTGRLSDPNELVKLLHDNGLLACARVVAFKDPLLSQYVENGAYPYAVLDSSTGFPWEQDNGETWANMMDESIHEYLIGIIAELVAFGFDQIQLDYLRFPSDGPTERCFYPVAIDSLNKAEVIGLFLSRVRQVTDTADVSLAADVFGWVPWLKRDKSYWIGQDYDVIASWADVICPMLYSSHFPEEFKEEFGPLRAYWIIREGTARSVSRSGRRNTGVQPYIQSFNYRSPYYGPDYVLQQMQAAIEGGGVGWIAWNARSDYSMLWKALEKFETLSQCKLGNE
ncbi:MAG: hypothetical protein FVQ81_00500 [Candidatus Glassbacteria bacterium]|nr:hypothetical protein [Candidatus Glassbacteria bacterium]